MNKTLKLALGAVLCVGFVLPVIAQDNFPDVPDNHWAYEALARLKKDGLLVGYPDGLFRGNRPASRYELAVAINAVYEHMKSITDGLQSEIDQLKGGMQPTDLSALKDQISQLQDEVNSMKGWGDDIDNLKKLADEFQKELASLGVDVEGLKRDLSDLAKRVGVLEAHRLPIDIHGDANIFMMAGASNDHKPGITEMGRPVGVRIPNGAGAFASAGMDVDSTIYHELDLRLTSNNDKGPKWHGDVAVGNMLGTVTNAYSARNAAAFPSMSGTFDAANGTGPTTPFGPGMESVYIQDLAVDFDTSILNQGLALEIGRTGYNIDPYIFQRPNPNPYFQNDRWGDGKWYFDGGILGFHWSGVKLDVFGGKQDEASTTNGTPLNYMSVGAVGHPYLPNSGFRPVGLGFANAGYNAAGVNGNPAGMAGIPVDSDLGLNLSIPLTTNGKLDLAYIWFESNDGVGPNDVQPTFGGVPSVANRADVYGGDLKWNFGNLVFDGGYSASDLKMGNSNVVNKNNYAWHANLAWDASRWGVSAGYRDIQPQFGAPGDWGRIGIWWNPTDIEGPMANVHFNFSNQLKLTAGGEWYQGTGSNYGSFAGKPYAIAANSGLTNSDKINHYTAELSWRWNDSWDMSLGTELVYWHIPQAGAGMKDPTEQWFNLGLGYNLSDQARLSFLYQYSNYDTKGNGDFGVFALGGAFGGTKYTGSLLTTQLTVKF